MSRNPKSGSEKPKRPRQPFAERWMDVLDAAGEVESDLAHLNDEWFSKFNDALHALTADATSLDLSIEGWEIILDREPRPTYPDGDMPKRDYEFLPTRRVRLILCKRDDNYVLRVRVQDVVWLKPQISL